MGRYALFNDFLMSSIRSHFEVLTELYYLGTDDDRLLVPALFYLGSVRGQRARIRQRMGAQCSQHSAGYEIFEQLSVTLSQRNAVRMIELALLLRKLRRHNYNIFEYCYLAIGNSVIEVQLLRWAAFSLIAQILLLVILMYYNMSDITNVTLWSKDWGTIVVVIITTLFFIKLVYVQYRGASDFYAVFWQAGRFINRGSMQLRKALLWINIFSNQYIGIFVVLFNISSLMISRDVNNAIASSFLILSILEIDDMLKPDWNETDFDKFVALTVLPYLIVADNGGGVQVDIMSSSASEEEYFLLLESDDKVYLEATECDGQLLVNVYWRRSQFRYDTVQFQISGDNGRDFFDNIKEFRCVQTAASLSSTFWDNWMSNLEAGVDYGQELLEDLRQNQQVASGGARTVPLASVDTLASTSSFDAPSDEQASV